jgi:rhodanese-related sulfurtransferase
VNPAAGLDARGLPAGYLLRPELEITPRQTREAIKSAQTPPLLVDCRRPDEWDLARIQGAVHLPMDEIERRADELEGDEGQRDHPVIVYCHHGRRSLRVTLALKAMGFTDVRSMAGGIDLWSIDIDPSVPRY